MKFEQAMKRLTEKFTSANSIPVERATITREEWEAILGELCLLKSERNVALGIERF